MAVKYISVAIPDVAIKKFSEYLHDNHIEDTVLGMTLSFGVFFCEVRVYSKEFENVKK